MRYSERRWITAIKSWSFITAYGDSPDSAFRRSFTTLAETPTSAPFTRAIHQYSSRSRGGRCSILWGSSPHTWNSSLTSHEHYLSLPPGIDHMQSYEPRLRARLGASQSRLRGYSGLTSPSFCCFALFAPANFHPK